MNLPAEFVTGNAYTDVYPLGLGSELSYTSSQIGSGLVKVAPATGPAAPFVAAAGGIAQIVGAVAALFSGCGATCVQATQIVNQVEPYLQQNLALYFDNPKRTTTDQQNALATFQQIWQQVAAACGNPNLGQAGVNCVAERGAGGCKWQANGECWNWFIGYYYPIRDDVPPGGTGVAALFSGTGAGGTLNVSSLMPVLVAAALIFVVWKL